VAGDWIKIRVDLSDDPAVFMLSDILGLDCPTLVGHLVMFWSWMDRHTSDGKAIKLTQNVIDKKIGVQNFAVALRKVGWLCGEDMALELPNFERHNGDSAKARALESEAKRLRRGSKDAATPEPEKHPENAVGQVSDKTRAERPTREEKRREEKKELQDQNPSVLTDDGGDRKKPPAVPKPELITKRGRKLVGKKLMAFELFWTAFDYKKDRAAAADAWFDLELTDDLFDQILRAAKAWATARPYELANGKTPIYPQGWLTGRRWEDEIVIPIARLPAGRQPETLDATFERFTDRSWGEGLQTAIGG